MKTMTKEKQDKMTPSDAIQALMEGNQRFVSNLKLNRNLLQQVNETRDGQSPFAVIISCMDSRTCAELIFDQGLGDIFSIRIAGNVINDEIIASAEFGCQIVGAKIIFVLGHTGCGAIKGAIDGVKMGHLEAITSKINRCINEEQCFNSEQEKTAYITNSNVQNAMHDIKSKSSIIANLEKEGKLKIIGGIYEVESGIVNLLPNYEQS